MMRAPILLAGLLGMACTVVEDDREARWSYIATAIIEPNCATSGCHSKLTRSSGIELETRETAYTTLVGTDARGNFVVPFQPDRSQLLYLLRGQDTWRMPPDQPLSETDIKLIERWILDGAADN